MDRPPLGEVTEQIYKEKLDQLMQELRSLNEGVHPEYLSGVERLRKKRDEEVAYENLIFQLESERIEREYQMEIEMAEREMEERKQELLETMLNETDERKKQIEYEHQNMDINSSTNFMYPANKKILRRRANEPSTLTDKRQRRNNPQQVTYLLAEPDIIDDVRTVNCSTDEPHATYTATIDNGKLTYDGKCYLRGQTVYVETDDMGKLAAVIQSIATNVIHFKSVGDNRRITATLHELQKGLVLLRKRSS